MWAFVIWDNVARQLFFSRDRFGVKPLLVLATPQGIASASEAKAFAALSWPAGITAIRAGSCATITGGMDSSAVLAMVNALGTEAVARRPRESTNTCI